MSKFIDNIAVIHNNIFSLTPILVSFYRNMKNQERNVLLAYFVFPIVFNQECLNDLIEIRSNSRLSRIAMNKKYMAGFSERFDNYKSLTDNCLRYAIECKYIKVEDDLSVTVYKDISLHPGAFLNDNIRLASQLHKIFTLDVLNTYLAFGIKHL